MRFALVLVGLLASGVAAEEFIIVQSTTSTRNAGLYEAILPLFEAESGIEVRVVAVGTGQALRNAQNCDGDAVLVHARAAEEAFVAAGYGLARHDVMYNDFVLIGPERDPAAIAGLSNAQTALAQIAEAGAVFVSRGDDSGTHTRERALWAGTSVDLAAVSGSWYRESGSGMGATLNIALGMNAYTLTDRASWIAFANKGDHRILVEGDPALLNQYGAIAVSRAHCPTVKAEAAQAFVDWLVSADGQAAIAGFHIHGQQVFFPNADPVR
ncbi:MAG: substrate-binding domain-containing protein [Pseudomonadota bacterium]